MAASALYLIAVTLGLFAARLQQPRLRWQAPNLRATPLVVVALALQSTAYLPPVRAWSPGPLVASLMILGIWLALNARPPTAFRPALALIALGLAGNALVIAMNGAMPLSRWALTKSGASDQEQTRVLQGEFYKHQLANSRTRIAELGDVIPIPGAHVAISASDVVLCLGVGLFAFILGGGIPVKSPIRRSPDLVRSPTSPAPE